MSSDDESGFIVRTISAPDGLRLYARDYGRADLATSSLPPIVCLPGLTRNSRDFHQLALLLSRDSIVPRRVIALDARGRGLSAWDDDKSHYNLVVEAQDVLANMRGSEYPKGHFHRYVARRAHPAPACRQPTRYSEGSHSQRRRPRSRKGRGLAISATI